MKSMKRNGYGYQPTSDPTAHKTQNNKKQIKLIKLGVLTLSEARGICKKFSQNRTFFDHKDCPLYSICGKSFGNEFVDLNQEIKVENNEQ